MNPLLTLILIKNLLLAILLIYAIGNRKTTVYCGCRKYVVEANREIKKAQDIIDKVNFKIKKHE